MKPWALSPPTPPWWRPESEASGPRRRLTQTAAGADIRAMLPRYRTWSEQLYFRSSGYALDGLPRTLSISCTETGPNDVGRLCNSAQPAIGQAPAMYTYIFSVLWLAGAVFLCYKDKGGGQCCLRLGRDVAWVGCASVLQGQRRRSTEALWVGHAVCAVAWSCCASGQFPPNFPSPPCSFAFFYTCFINTATVVQ